ncbi:MAG: methylmalonyl Co-A mutase-associated GTPase MeaB [Candidatus Riflebacteria bacterium]|nr:methylmalonyl Co-A mutase-associated GTPase MeaB [Candidatus Riflebacteria bacterium]
MEPLLEKFRRGDRRALARLITHVEDRTPLGLAALRELYTETGRARTVGVTGAPGTGKSTLVDRLAAALRADGLRVAVLAVDPSSPFTGGAILADRVRMRSLADDPELYVRSMASRGALGGLARATASVLKVLDAFGFDVILVETVGVGQGEVEIVREAETCLVLEVPGLGDGIQAIKAGVLEIGHIFVVNKADNPGADRVAEQISTMLALNPTPPDWEPPVVCTVASQGTGVPELLQHVRGHWAYADGRDLRDRARGQRRLADLAETLKARALGNASRRVLARPDWPELRRRVECGELDPYEAADLLVPAEGNEEWTLP